MLTVISFESQQFIYAIAKIILLAAILSISLPTLFAAICLIAPVLTKLLVGMAVIAMFGFVSFPRGGKL